MFAIVGGGICGLGIGWRLAAAGAEVVVVDSGEAGQGATWAAAGMLAPQAEAEHGEEALLPLLLESRAMWAGFAAELEAASGIDVGYRTEGTVVVALDRDDREFLEQRHTYLTSLGLYVEWLTGRAARKREPGLAPAVTGGIYSPLDHQVDNRAVFEALRTAYLAAGGTLIENTPVEEIAMSGGRAAGIRLPDREIAAETVVLAAGAWSRLVPGLPEPSRPPVRPLKGQMIALQMDPAAPLVEHVVWGPDIYIVPRRDGRLVIGATVEEMGFDTQMTAGGLYELTRHAWETLPGIYDLPVIEAWAGLRPASRDDAPILGASDIPGLVIATGHHRNGILLAPVTADAISGLVLRGETRESVRPFGPERFAAPARQKEGVA